MINYNNMSAFDRTLTLENVSQKYTNIGTKLTSDPYGELRKIKLELLINHYNKGKIIIPDIQRVRNEDIIDEMILTCDENIYTLIHSTNPLQFCVCGGVYALIDGQHRLETFKIMFEKNNHKYNNVFIPIHVINDISELDIYKLYMNLNRNNPDIYNNVTCLDDVFRVKNYNNLKRLIHNKYPSSFKKSTNICGIDEFVNLLSSLDFLNYYSNPNIAFEYMEEINIGCYDAYDDNDIDSLTTLEYEIYDTGFIGALKRNNYFEILMNDNPDYDDFTHIVPKRGRPDTQKPVKKQCIKN